MNKDIKGNILHAITVVILFVIVLCGIIVAYPAWRRGCALKRQDAELSARIDQKKAEIAQLKEFQRRFKTDPNFVEMIARRNRRVYPGEYVFIFDD